jgi:hypothetical protein
MGQALASERTWTVAATLQRREDSQHPALFFDFASGLLASYGVLLEYPGFSPRKRDLRGPSRETWAPQSDGGVAARHPVRTSELAHPRYPRYH